MGIHGYILIFGYLLIINHRCPSLETPPSTCIWIFQKTMDLGFSESPLLHQNSQCSFAITFFGGQSGQSPLSIRLSDPHIIGALVIPPMVFLDNPHYLHDNPPLLMLNIHKTLHILRCKPHYCWRLTANGHIISPNKFAVIHKTPIIVRCILIS